MPFVTKYGMTNTISKGEKFILDQGLYVAEPICFMLLFSQAERDVLNSIRHCTNVGERYVSLSALHQMTQMSENTIKKARDNLLKEGFIEQKETSKAGTHYDVVYKKLNNVVAELNSIRDPQERATRAMQLRNNKQKE